MHPHVTFLETEAIPAYKHLCEITSVLEGTPLINQDGFINCTLNWPRVAVRSRNRFDFCVGTEFLPEEIVHERPLATLFVCVEGPLSRSQRHHAHTRSSTTSINCLRTSTGDMQWSVRWMDSTISDAEGLHEIEHQLRQIVGLGATEEVVRCSRDEAFIRANQLMAWIQQNTEASQG